MSAAGPLTSPERPEGLPPRRASRGKPWRAFWALPIALAAVVAGAITYTLVSVIRDALTTPPTHQDGVIGVALHGTPPILSLTSTLVQDLVLIAGAALAAAAAYPRPLRLRPADFGLRPARLASSVGLVIAGYVTFVILAALWTSALGIQDRQSVTVDLGTRDSGWALAGALFLVCVAAPVCEELFFRGFLFGALRRHGLVRAAGVTGLAFGLAHVASSPIGFIVPLAALGVILCLLYERTGSLYPCIGLHALNNSIAFGVGDGRGWLIPICLVAALAILYAVARGSRRLASPL